MYLLPERLFWTIEPNVQAVIGTLCHPSLRRLQLDRIPINACDQSASDINLDIFSDRREALLLEGLSPNHSGVVVDDLIPAA
jgi:hypothetical protein